MTDEEKRFDRREEARLDEMYDAQFEPEEEDDMNREDIARMAREAGWTGPEENVTYVAMLERFANLVAAAEREACAQICDEQMEWGEINKSMAVAAGNCADLIRERGAP